jgi:uncharacterized repeat protein (TIGR03803 family)
MRAKTILLCIFLFVSAMNVGAQTYKTLVSFDSFNLGSNPYPGLAFDRAGNLYGVAAWAQVWEGTVFQLSPSAGDWKLHILHQFDPYEWEGAGPIGGLAVDEAGNVYGTTSYDHNPDGGCGSVFKLYPSGSSYTLTYLRYYYYDGAEGCDPEATLTYSKGVISGATRGGGLTGQGTVFSMDTYGGSFQFNSFTGKKGSQPLSAFTLWGYGTTFSGGGKGQGEIYRLDSAKGLVRVHSFNLDGGLGYAPQGDLLTLYVGGARTIYGTNSAGGAGGGGTVYRLTEVEPNSNRWRTRLLYSFTSGSGEGWAPMAGLTADAAGNLYGTTYSGGQDGRDCGTVFKLSPGKNNKWTHTVLYSFDPSQSEACGPTGGVVFDKAGNLYGTTQWGGDYGYGTVYEIIP